MNITFTTKSESKASQEQAFLKLSPSQRFYAFLKLCSDVNQFPVSRRRQPNPSNFILEKKSQNE
ncbi:hypothetical protein [Leeuwenhoekiella parthenopeia]|uniref:Uncharacterized protein n=1 Tax=Leeuwenhoekiella parthenopeia TaxID=2890320 RepID=A0ABS8GPZ3_9FLAO|nr:hypothetical protein [Leeuwenhoekiella parthenopeia]MCC4211826.1 hypothetical protein [Leeuwenhoekiella parthenopeia]